MISTKIPRINRGPTRRAVEQIKTVYKTELLWPIHSIVINENRGYNPILLFMDIINKGCIVCSTNNYTTIIWYHICAVCSVCGLRSSSFEFTGVCILYLLEFLLAGIDDAVTMASKVLFPFVKKVTRHKKKMSAYFRTSESCYHHGQQI